MSSFHVIRHVIGDAFQRVYVDDTIADLTFTHALNSFVTTHTVASTTQTSAVLPDTYRGGGTILTTVTVILSPRV